MTLPTTPWRRPLLASALMLLAIAGCAGSRQATVAPARSPGLPSAGATVPSSATPGTGSSAPTTAPETTAPTGSATPEPSESGGSTAHGDIPDNAVFLTYRDAGHGISIQYVEGWQVTPGGDGVVIRDKDSSETVQVVPAVSDVASYISSMDLPALQATAGFKLEKQDIVKVGSQRYAHLLYHAPAAPDPVTGKEVPSLVDRYYVPGTGGLALVTLSTPDGVDNVDAFRTMIESFRWQ